MTDLMMARQPDMTYWELTATDNHVRNMTCLCIQFHRDSVGRMLAYTYLHDAKQELQQDPAASAHDACLLNLQHRGIWTPNSEAYSDPRFSASATARHSTLAFKDDAFFQFFRLGCGMSTTTSTCTTGGGTSGICQRHSVPPCSSSVATASAR